MIGHPWWAYVAGATLALAAMRILAVALFEGEGDPWLWYRHAVETCDPKRQPLGGFRCACGRVGESYDDFAGQGEGYVGLHRRLYTREGDSQERVLWDAPEGGRQCRDEQG